MSLMNAYIAQKTLVTSTIERFMNHFIANSILIEKFINVAFVIINHRARLRLKSIQLLVMDREEKNISQLTHGISSAHVQLLVLTYTL